MGQTIEVVTNDAIMHDAYALGLANYRSNRIELFPLSKSTGIKQHYHVPAAQNAAYIPPDSRWYATTGSFRRLYSTPGLGAVDYGEIAGYAPSEIGYAKVIVRGGNVIAVQKVVA
jgi:hypothetical protein